PFGTISGASPEFSQATEAEGEGREETRTRGHSPFIIPIEPRKRAVRPGNHRGFPDNAGAPNGPAIPREIPGGMTRCFKKGDAVPPLAGVSWLLIDDRDELYTGRELPSPFQTDLLTGTRRSGRGQGFLPMPSPRSTVLAFLCLALPWSSTRADEATLREQA